MSNAAAGEIRRALLAHPRLQIPADLRRRGDEPARENSADSPRVRAGTPLSTVLNMLNTMVGTGIFALPFCMSLSNPVVTTITLVAVAIISYIAMLTVGMILPGFVFEDSYHAMASKLCRGATTIRVIDWTLCLSLVGVVAMLLVVSYDCFSIELASVIPTSRPLSGLVLAAIGCVLSWPKSLHGMRFISGVGVLLLISAWALVIATAVLGCPSEPEIPQSQHTKGFIVNASTILGTAMLVFGCHVNLPRLYSELPLKTRPQMPIIMALSIVITITIYLAFALAAVSSPCFGYGQSSNILLSLPHTTAFAALRVGFGVISLTKIPLAVHPIRHILLESTQKSLTGPAYAFFTLAIIALAYALFVTFTALSDITSVVGALGVLGSMMFFPSILLYQSSKGYGMSAHSTALLSHGGSMTAGYWSIRQRRAVSIFLAVCGGIAAVVTLPGIVMKVFYFF
ncbi:hypothetical protein FOZ63_029568 [Perkinsus olseni]|uniref:Transmembrane amino acid transporter protein n=2 Tax=Perkinsus olseni TaxID=32597 RepID=A0A7J6T3U7_PEROL|nr:hypothetical protein FOZ63_029568 [Perkinsus olseni]KAF4746063.1 Transmembrane amino acid transporter protein [Perkinsus olseni]